MRDASINQDAQGFTGTVQAIGEQAGVGFIQRVAVVIKGSLQETDRSVR